MTTNTQHAGNGDTATHSRKADEAVARKYYTQVEGKTLEEARAIIKRLIEKGILKDSAYYNQAIVRDTKEKERVKARDDKRKEQEEAEAKARADFEKARAERDAQAKKDKDEGVKGEPYTLSFEVLAIIQDFIGKGCDKNTIKGMLKTLGGLNKGQVERAINDLMPERAHSARGESLDDKFHRFLLEGIKTTAEMIAYINEIGSPNFIRVTPTLLKRGEFFNALHRKYSKGE